MAGETLPPVLFVLKTDATQGIDGVKKFRDAAVSGSGDAGGAFTKLEKVGKAAFAGLGIAAGGAAVAFAKLGFDDLKNTQAAVAQLSAGVKSTGGVAGVTVGQMTNLSKSIQDYSGQTKTSIDQSEALLLTFTNIKNSAGASNDIFNQATKATADMAARMGTDASSSAIQLGKALNDPIKGITALTRVGVSFTDAQKQQITAMENSGNIMGAQKVILGELTKEFGGSAEAAGKTLPGELARAKESLEDVAGSVIARLLPGLSALAGFVDDKLVPALAVIYAKVAPPVEAAFTDIVDAVKALVGVFTGGGSDALDHFSGPVANGLITAGSLLRQAFDALAALWRTNVVPAAHLIGDVLQNNVLPALRTLGGFLLNDVIPAFQAMGRFIAQHATLFRALAVAVGTMIVAWKAYQVTMAVVKAAQEAFVAVQAAVNAVLDANPIGIIIVALAGLAAAFVFAYKNSATFRDIVQGVLHGVVVAFDAVKTTVAAVFDFITDHWKIILAVVLGPMGVAIDELVTHWKTFQQIIAAVWGGIEDAVKAAWSVIKPILDTMKDAIGDVTGGISKITGAVSGIEKGAGAVLKHLPHFAGGGVVSSPTLALVGEAGPEAIVPLSGNGGRVSSLPGGSSSGSGGVTAQPVNVQINGQTIISFLLQYQRSGGVVAITRNGIPLGA